MELKNIKAHYLLCFIFLFSALKLSAQNQMLADSLISIYTSQSLSDSASLSILREISFEHTIPDVKLSYSNKLIEKALHSDNKHFLHSGYMQKGYAYKAKGDLDKALKFFLSGLEVAKSISYQAGIGSAYVAIADTYLINKNLDNATLYYGKAITLFESTNDTVKLATGLLNLGDLYLNTPHQDTALLYLNRSLLLFQKSGHDIGEAYCLGNIGLANAKLGNSTVAEENILEASQILMKLGDHFPVAVYYIYLATIYQEKGLTEKAFDFAHRSLKIAQNAGLKEQIRDASLKLSELYEYQQAFAEAYNFQKQYIIYRDSINNEETIRKMADLRTEFEVAQKQNEINYLKEERSQQQQHLIGLIFIILLACILIFVLYRHNRQKQTSNLILTQQKQELEFQHNQLEALNNTRNKFFSIISHDLRGPVNAFNGISKLIGHYIGTNDLKQLIEVSNYIDTSASQLSALLDNLLSWSITQQGEFPYTPEKVQLKGLSEEIIGIFRTMAHAKNIHLVAFVEEDIEVWADSNSLLTILRNLTSNALKFTMDGGTVTLSAVVKDQFVEIKVADTGIGMSQDRLNSLFTLREEKRT